LLQSEPELGPVNFGGGGLFLATNGTGDHVEMAGSNSLLAVPTGYVSGTAPVRQRDLEQYGT